MPEPKHFRFTRMMASSELKRLAACSFRWFIVAESTVRWFVVREKHCWMVADSAE
jgi:hypothetical protein